MKNIIIVVLAILLGAVAMYANAMRVIVTTNNGIGNSFVAKQLKAKNNCEDTLDGVFVRDEARRVNFCRTDNGYIKL